MLLSQKQGVLEFPKWLSTLYLIPSFCVSGKAALEPTGKDYKKKRCWLNKKANTESSHKGTACPNNKLHPVPGINGKAEVLLYEGGQSGWQMAKAPFNYTMMSFTLTCVFADRFLVFLKDN